MTKPTLSSIRLRFNKERHFVKHWENTDNKGSNMNDWIISLWIVFHVKLFFLLHLHLLLLLLFLPSSLLFLNNMGKRKKLKEFNDYPLQVTYRCLCQKWTFEREYENDQPLESLHFWDICSQIQTPLLKDQRQRIKLLEKQFSSFQQIFIGSKTCPYFSSLGFLI